MQIFSGKFKLDEKLRKKYVHLDCMQHHLTITEIAVHAISTPYLVRRTSDPQALPCRRCT